MRRYVIAPIVVCALAARVSADTQAVDLSRATIEELMNMEVTSVSRTEERISDAAAAIYVITRDDIRRSGLATIPELLRLAPGVQVARLNGNKWAVSIRGFNDLFSNKLLVLVDGRSIYNRTFSGVFWEDVAVPVRSIDRIEVVRGPGGALWGANAVNGVINIVTQRAADAKGTAVDVSLGTFDRTQVASQYGGSLGQVHYRLNADWADRGDSSYYDGGHADDRWHSVDAGFRADWSQGADEISIASSGSVAGGRSLWTRYSAPDPATFVLGDDTKVGNYALQGSWTHTFAGNRSVHARLSLDVWDRRDGSIRDRERASDVDVQYVTPLGRRHKIVAGTQVRDITGLFRGNYTISVPTPDFLTGADSAFVQDSFEVTRRVRLIGGVKLEHDDEFGWNVQPTTRALWDLGHQHIWAALSRAVRTPSLLERQERLNLAVVSGPSLPIVISVLGDANAKPERHYLAEGGWRLQVGDRWTLDAAVFQGHYDGLTTQEPLAPRFEATPLPAHIVAASQLSNGLEADTTGFELALRWAPRSNWRVDGSYSALRVTPYPSATSRDPLAAAFDANAPAHQWQVHTSTDVTPRVTINGSFAFTGRLQALQADAYTRTDANVEFRLSPRTSLLAIGQNLCSTQHGEYGTMPAPVLQTAIPHSAQVQLRWRIP